eukprot:812664_1
MMDAWEDSNRHRADSIENNRTVKVLREDNFVNERSENICVGDIIKIHNNEAVPADVILLSTENGTSDAFFDFSSLYGKSDLKTKRAVGCTARAKSSEMLSKLSGHVVVRSQNALSSSFVGILISPAGSNSCTLSSENIALRG